MLIQPSSLAELSGALPGVAGSLRVASVEVDADPLTVVRAGAHVFGFAGYFGTSGGDEIGGLGAAWQTRSPFGAGRLGDLSTQVASVAAGDPWARFLLGFSFSAEGAHRTEWDGFTPSSAVLPAVGVVRRAGTTRLVVALAPGRSFADLAKLLTGLDDEPASSGRRPADHALESRPSPSDWEQSVEEAVDAIRRGVMRKVVLARSVLVKSDVVPMPFELVARLRADYPACYVYGWQQGDAAFVGASPELLVARDGRSVRSHPLAGSAPRGEGEVEDDALGQELMASSKNRAEHRVVVDDIADRLRPLTSELVVDARPSLRKMTHVQHLSSELSGTLAGNQTVLQLAEMLHPTPAVGGDPRGEALSFIDKAEAIDRGWYAGGIGWTDRDGNGLVSVALRCALLRGNRAWLYAGAGIVADSEPSAELEETRLKFRTMLNLLTEA